MEIGLSNTIFRGEPLKFFLKTVGYLEMPWVEIKTELLREKYRMAVQILNGKREKPPYKHVKNISVHGSYRGVNLAAITPAQVRRHHQDIDFARAIHSDRVIFHVGYAPGGKDQEALDRVVSVLRDYLEYTADTDILLLLENTRLAPDKLCSELAHFEYLFDQLDHDRLGMVLDVVNLVETTHEQEKALFKALKPKIRHMHASTLPVHEGPWEFKQFVKYFVHGLDIKDATIPVILEGKTRLVRELEFVYALQRKTRE